MSKDKSMDEVLKDLDNLSPDDKQKEEIMRSKIDKFRDLAKELGLDMLLMVRDSSAGNSAGTIMRNSCLTDENEFSVANGLLVILIRKLIDFDQMFLLSVLTALKDVPNVNFKIED